MKKNSLLRSHELAEQMTRLGFSFYGDTSYRSADLERVILSICGQFPIEIKDFKILLTWSEQGHHLIHVERLKALYEQIQEPSLELRIGLYIFTSRQAEMDRRFQLFDSLLGKEIKKNSETYQKCVQDFNDPFMTEKHGVCLPLKKLGVLCYSIPPAEEKKILPFKMILKNNLWLRLRVLVGANYRADVLYFRFALRVETAYRAWKQIGCSQETAYRLWKELEAIGEMTVFSLEEN